MMAQWWRVDLRQGWFLAEDAEVHVHVIWGGVLMMVLLAAMAFGLGGGKLREEELPPGKEVLGQAALRGGRAGGG